MTQASSIVFAVLCSLLPLACGSNPSSLKDVEVGSDCTNMYRYATTGSPGFIIQNMPSGLTEATGLSRRSDGLAWSKPGSIHVFKHVSTFGGGKGGAPSTSITDIHLYIPPAGGFLLFGPYLNIGSGGTLRAEVDYEAFEANVTWDVSTGGTIFSSETVRYEANQALAGTWYSKPFAVGAGISGLEVRAAVSDIKNSGGPASAQEKLAWVPSVKIKEVRIIHTSPDELTAFGDPTCR